MKPLLMFYIKGKPGTHAVSCHIVVLAWRRGANRRQEGEKKKKSAVLFLFCFVFLTWKEAEFHGNTPEMPHTGILYSYT